MWRFVIFLQIIVCVMSEDVVNSVTDGTESVEASDPLIR